MLFLSKSENDNKILTMLTLITRKKGYSLKKMSKLVIDRNIFLVKNQLIECQLNSEQSIKDNKKKSIFSFSFKTKENYLKDLLDN